MPKSDPPSDQPHIPSAFEAQHVAATMKQLMGANFLKMAREFGLDIEGMAALVPIAVALRDERKKRGLSYADAARALQAKQKDLKAIEAGEPGGVDGQLLARYAEWLGLADHLRQWARAQPGLAERIGLPEELQLAPGKRPPSGDAPLFPDMPLSAPPPKPLPPGHTFPISLDANDPTFARFELLKRLAEGDPALTELMETEFAATKDDDLEMFEDSDDDVRGQPAAPAIYEFELTLLHVKPRIWRRFRVSNTLTLAQLHEVVQAVMGWTDSHLHAFELSGERFERSSPHESFGDFGSDAKDERKFRLADFPLREKAEIFYEYDFGDGWGHRLVLKKILPHEPGTAPVCLKGAGACPPEDCGGPWGYGELLQALHDPSHADHEHLAEWVGDDFDPERFDAAEQSALLAAVAKRWRPRMRRKRGRG